jgi:hypothetical protein
MLDKYNARQQTILARLGRIETLLNDPAYWWHALPSSAQFRHFCANVRRNFGTDSSGNSGHGRINDPVRWQQWRSDLAAAIARYPTECAAWEQALCAA